MKSLEKYWLCKEDWISVEDSNSLELVGKYNNILEVVNKIKESHETYHLYKNQDNKFKLIYKGVI